MIQEVGYGLIAKTNERKPLLLEQLPPFFRSDGEAFLEEYVSDGTS